MKIHKFPFVDFSKNTVDFIENDTTLEVVVEEEIIQAVIEEQQETIIVSNDTIPQYNQQQLDDMLRDAFEKGKKTGLELAEANIQPIDAIIKSLHNKITLFDNIINTILAVWTDNCLLLAYNIAQHIIESFKTICPEYIFIDFLKNNLNNYVEHHNVTIELHPFIADKIAGISAFVNIKILANEEFNMDRCEIFYNKTLISKDNKEILLKIEELIKQALSNKST